AVELPFTGSEWAAGHLAHQADEDGAGAGKGCLRVIEARQGCYTCGLGYLTGQATGAGEQQSPAHGELERRSLVVAGIDVRFAGWEPDGLAVGRLLGEEVAEAVPVRGDVVAFDADGDL